MQLSKCRAASQFTGSKTVQLRCCQGIRTLWCATWCRQRGRVGLRLALVAGVRKLVVCSNLYFNAVASNDTVLTLVKETLMLHQKAWVCILNKCAVVSVGAFMQGVRHNTGEGLTCVPGQPDALTLRRQTGACRCHNSCHTLGMCACSSTCTCSFRLQAASDLGVGVSGTSN